MLNELAGYRVLVIEDEYFLARDLEDTLTQAGAEVIGPLGQLQDALDQVRRDGFELAVLDLNLGGSLAYSVADALTAQGVPFVFASAYALSDIPQRFKNLRYVEKPYHPLAVIRALSRLIRSTHDD